MVELLAGKGGVVTAGCGGVCQMRLFNQAKIPVAMALIREQMVPIKEFPIEWDTEPIQIKF